MAAGSSTKALPRVMTVREAAHALHTTEQAIYRRIRRGTLVTIRDGRRVLVLRDVVEALLGGDRRPPRGRDTMPPGLRGLSEPCMRGQPHAQHKNNRTTCHNNFFSILPAKRGRAKWEVNFYIHVPGRKRPRNVRRRSPHAGNADTRRWAQVLLVELAAEVPAPVLEEGGPVTLSSACARWLAAQDADLANKRRFVRWILLAWGEDTLVAALTHEQLTGLKATLRKPLGPRASARSRKRRPKRDGRQRHRKGEGLEPGTIRAVCQAANSILAFSAGMGWREPARVPLPAVPIPDPEWLTADELRALVAVSGRWRPVVMLAARAGLRRGELVELRWRDIDLDHAQIRVSRAYKQREGPEGGREWTVHTTKGKRGRTVPIPRDLVQVLRLLEGRPNELVVLGDDGQRVMPWVLSELLPTLMHKAGLDRPGLGLHSLRHTYCSHLAQGGAPAKAIQTVAGHRSPRTTDRYMHLAPSHVEQAVQCLPDLDPGVDETSTKLNEKAPEFGG